MQMCAAGRFGSIASALRAASTAFENWLFLRCSSHSRACSAARTTLLRRWAIASPTDGAVPGLLAYNVRSEEHTSELQSHSDLVCRLLLEKKKKRKITLLRMNMRST